MDIDTLEAADYRPSEHAWVMDKIIWKCTCCNSILEEVISDFDNPPVYYENLKLANK